MLSTPKVHRKQPVTLPSQICLIVPLQPTRETCNIQLGYRLQTITFPQWDAPPGLAQPPPLMERPLVVDGGTCSRTKLSRPRYAPSELLHHLLWTTRDCTDGYTDGRVLLCCLWSAWLSQSHSNATHQCRRSAVVHYGTGGLQLPSVGRPISSAFHRTAPAAWSMDEYLPQPMAAWV